MEKTSYGKSGQVARSHPRVRAALISESILSMVIVRIKPTQ